MRGVADALRSVARHADLVLNEGPATLGEVWWSPTGLYEDAAFRWTHRGVSPGALEVDEGEWAKLATADLGGPVAMSAQARRWERRQLRWAPWDELTGLTREAPQPSSLAPRGKNPWEVRLAADRGEITYPFCRVNLTAPSAHQAAAGVATVVQPMSLECYALETADPEEALLAAARAGDALTRGFFMEGVPEPGLGTRARPRSVPLFDYDAVPLDEGVTARRLPSDYMKVQDWGTRQLVDPQDQRRVMVVAEMRLAWRVRLAPPRGHRVTESVELGGNFA